MTNEEFYTNVLVPAVTNLGLSDITEEKLRWLSGEIDLFLGEYIKPEVKPHGLRLCEARGDGTYRTGWLLAWTDNGAIVEFEGGSCGHIPVYNIRFLDTPPLPQLPEAEK